MTVEDVRKICVVGAGFMGSQIAMVAALHGYETANTDVDPGAFDRARRDLRRVLERRVEQGRMTPEELDAAFRRITYTTDLERAAAGADFVIEAVIEDLDLKQRVFADLDRFAPPHAVLATNSSTIVSSRIAPATRRPERVLNMHFFSPALKMELVEVVMSEHTSGEAAGVTMGLARRLGKTPILLRKEIPGFVVNRILGLMMDEALRLYQDGVADFRDIDLAVKKALGHPMGPFELMDFVGVDVAYLVRLQRWRETGDDALRPPRTLQELYDQGRWGRKAGRGFYNYEEGAV